MLPPSKVIAPPDPITHNKPSPKQAHLTQNKLRPGKHAKLIDHLLNTPLPRSDFSKRTTHHWRPTNGFRGRKLAMEDPQFYSVAIPRKKHTEGRKIKSTRRKYPPTSLSITKNPNQVSSPRPGTASERCHRAEAKNQTRFPADSNLRSSGARPKTSTIRPSIHSAQRDLDSEKKTSSNSKHPTETSSEQKTKKKSSWRQDDVVRRNRAKTERGRIDRSSEG